MADLQLVFKTLYRVFNIPIYLFDFCFTFWQLFIFAVVGGMIVSFVKKLFN